MQLPPSAGKETNEPPCHFLSVFCHGGQVRGYVSRRHGEYDGGTSTKSTTEEEGKMEEGRDVGRKVRIMILYL